MRGGGCGKGGWMEARRMEGRVWRGWMRRSGWDGGWAGEDGWRGRAGVEGGGLDGGMEGAGRGGVEGWRGLSGWRDRTAQTEPHKPNCKKNRTETKAKPIPEKRTAALLILQLLSNCY